MLLIKWNKKIGIKLSVLNDYKDSMTIILNYIETNGIWEMIDNCVNLNVEIENLIKLFKNK